MTYILIICGVVFYYWLQRDEVISEEQELSELVMARLVDPQIVDVSLDDL